MWFIFPYMIDCVVIDGLRASDFIRLEGKKKKERREIITSSFMCLKQGGLLFMPEVPLVKGICWFAIGYEF